MIGIIKGHSRLVFIYLVTVALTCGLLVFLGVNSIGNYKELTEKRIIEEQMEIADRYLVAYEDLMDSLDLMISDTRTGTVRSDGHGLQKIFPQSDYLLFDSTDLLIDPPFIRTGFKRSGDSSPGFNKTFRSGEKEEFTAGRPDRAAVLYATSLESATNVHDSARACLAQARVFIKQGLYEEANGQYARIITELGEAVNNDGFPYAYLAIHQLLRSESDLDEEIIRVFLERILDNKIPYAGLITDVVAAIRAHRPHDPGHYNLQEKDSLCNLVEHKANLILEYTVQFENRIKANAVKDSSGQSFRIIHGKRDEDFLLYFADRDLFYGLVITFETVHQAVLHRLNLVEKQFEHIIALSGSSGTDSGKKRPLISRIKFPLSAGSTDVVISIRDPSRVNRYVFIRELATGLGLVLIILVSGSGFYLLLADIKRKRRMDILRADFVANVTHELKTPLTSIHMFADSILAGKAKTPEKLQKYSRVILKESEKLRRMVTNILEFSRKENEGLDYKLMECRLDMIVEDALNENIYWLDINKFKVHTEIEQGLSAMADPEGLKQVISNLISNAIKYSEETREVTVKVYGKNGKAVIEMWDRGIGIPKNEQALIFKKFYRVQAPEGARASGTGLGLTVSRDIVEAMGGELRVKSEINNGSTFSVILNKTPDHE